MGECFYGSASTAPVAQNTLLTLFIQSLLPLNQQFIVFEQTTQK